MNTANLFSVFRSSA